MAISKKILNQIENECDDDSIKEILLEILKFEDQGTYQYKDVYEKMINEYIQKERREE